MLRRPEPTEWRVEPPTLHVRAMEFPHSTSEACAFAQCSHIVSVGLILEPREGWIVTSSMLTPRQTNRPKRELLLPCAWKSLISVACLVFPFSLLWPTLLTCSGCTSVTATSLFFLEVFGLPAALLFELSCQLISRVQPGPMTCVSCLSGLRYVEPFCLLYLFISSFCCFFHATHIIHPSSSRRCPLSGAIEACATRLCSYTFSVGLILEPREGWIVTSSMLTPRQTNRPKTALTSMCM